MINITDKSMETAYGGWLKVNASLYQPLFHAWASYL